MIAQPDLWEQPPPPRGCRCGLPLIHANWCSGGHFQGQHDQTPYVAGSGTSYEAAQEIKPTVGNLRERVFEAIKAHPGISDERIAQLTRLNPSTARPRRLELQRAERIEFCGYTRTQAGRKSKAWRVVPGK